jgi:predicted alpha/beta hydrolase
MAVAQAISFTAADGKTLRGTCFSPENVPELPLVTIINAGAGIPASYYKRFADCLADRGIVTVTYDYRGIGKSRPVGLRGYRATIKDWGEFDAPAALCWARENFPDRSRAVIGHSIGGFLAGFVADVSLIDRLVLVGAHTGYWGDYARRAKTLMWAAWHVVMPLITWLFGYFPGSRLGLPEDLPAGVAYDWAARTQPEFTRNFRHANGSLDHERFAAICSRFSSLNIDVLAVTFSDDVFATAAGTARLRELFSGCRFNEVTIDAHTTNMHKIGHFGFFRSAARESIWPVVTDWLYAFASSRAEPAVPGHGEWRSSGSSVTDAHKVVASTRSIGKLD